MATSGMTSNIYKYIKAEDFILDASQAIEDFILWKLKGQDTLSIALSGGNSPKGVYQTLAKNKKIDWSKIEIFLVDERYVPKNSDQSNFKMIEEVLLSKIPPVKAFHDFNTNLLLEESAEAYDEVLEKRKGRLFDLVILGLGADGHTASLFPETEALKEKMKLATIGKSPDGLDRLTLTFPAIFTAEKIIFLIHGKEKESQVEKLISEKKPTKKEELMFPAKTIMKHPNVEIYYNCPN